ncbi:MAG: arginine--tRNA ligase [Patescibacteria group bacterium]
MRQIREKINRAIAAILPKGVDFDLASPSNPEMGDLSLPCFPLAKMLKKSPDEIAAELAKKLAGNRELQKFVSEIKARDGYLNFYFRSDVLAAMVIKEIFKKKEKYGNAPRGRGKRVMIEYVSPNSNKPLHLGHIRNALLGESLSNILETQGLKIIRASLINDRGAHICKSMLAYKLWGKDDTPDKSGMKPDHFVVKYYVMFGERAKQDPELEGEALEMLKLWEAGDKATLALWKKMNAWVYEGWKATYKTLGVKFDALDFESKIYKKGKEIIWRGEKAGVFVRDEKGNYIAKFNGLPDKVVLRADGTAVYATADLYLAGERFKKYHLDRLIYVVGAEQDLHFRQLFEIFKQLKFPWAGKVHHLNYSLILLPEGRLKSREGVKVDADEIVEKLSEISAEEIKNRYEALLPSREIDRRAKIIALAALKFYVLNVGPAAAIHFNPKEALSFTGKTGPYLQYVYARISSVLKKVPLRGMSRRDTSKHRSIEANFSLLNTAVDKKLIIVLGQFPEILEKAAQDLNPAEFTNYLYNLAKDFSDFYESEQILKAPAEVATARLALIRAIQIVLARGLNLLGIETLEEM